MQQESKKDDLFWLKVGTGVLVGSLLFSIGLFFVGSDKIITFIESIGQEEREAQQQAEEKIKFLQLQARLHEEEVERQRLKSEEEERKKAELEKQRQQELLSKISGMDGSAKEKEAKWERFFKPNPECGTPKNWKHQVECADERMKAEEKFEALYRAGKI